VFVRLASAGHGATLEELACGCSESTRG
jgi:hypothetical protein